MKPDARHISRRISFLTPLCPNPLLLVLTPLEQQDLTPRKLLCKDLIFSMRTTDGIWEKSGCLS